MFGTRYVASFDRVHSETDAALWPRSGDETTGAHACVTAAPAVIGAAAAAAVG